MHLILYLLTPEGIAPVPADAGLNIGHWTVDMRNKIVDMSNKIVDISPITRLPSNI